MTCQRSRQGRIPDDAFEGEEEVFEEDDLANELFDPAERDDLLAGVTINRGGEQSDDDAQAEQDGDAPMQSVPEEKR